MTAARQGLEPQLTVPETAVLPLDDRAKKAVEIALVKMYVHRTCHPGCSFPSRLSKILTPIHHTTVLIVCQKLRIIQVTGQYTQTLMTDDLPAMAVGIAQMRHTTILK